MKSSFVRISVTLVAAVAVHLGGLASRVEAQPKKSIIGGTTAKSTDYPSVGLLSAGGTCTGTLVAPKWVLTAAHCVSGKSATSVKFTVGGKTYSSDAIKVHPSYNPNAFSLGNDIALVHLTAAVSGITPAALASTAPKAKQSVTIVGFGLTGTGVTGQTTGAGTKRYGTQVIDFVLAPHILWMFDKNETSSIAQGDSGGPAFAMGTTSIVGVASGVSVGSGGKIGVWGTYAFETRVDIHRTWLVNTMATLK